MLKHRNSLIQSRQKKNVGIVNNFHKNSMLSQRLINVVRVEKRNKTCVSVNDIYIVWYNFDAR